MFDIGCRYGKSECCASEATADVFFQRLLYMRVFPMAPLPDADHAISASDPEVVARARAAFETLGELICAFATTPSALTEAERALDAEKLQCASAAKKRADDLFKEAATKLD